MGSKPRDLLAEGTTTTISEAFATQEQQRNAAAANKPPIEHLPGSNVERRDLLARVQPLGPCHADAVQSESNDQNKTL